MVAIAIFIYLRGNKRYFSTKRISGFRFIHVLSYKNASLNALGLIVYQGKVLKKTWKIKLKTKIQQFTMEVSLHVNP